MAVNAMMDWDNEFTIYFIQLYRDEPCLWNPSHKDHKVRHKIVDAWQRISDVTRKDVAELKRKRDSLMATFRNHTRKKKKSIIHGEEIYEPIWFAYAPLEAFLGDLYGTNTSKEHTDTNFSDTMDQFSDDSYHAKPSIVSHAEVFQPQQSPQQPQIPQPPPKRSRLSTNLREEEERHKNTRPHFMGNLVYRPNEEEESDIYRRMVARRREDDEKYNNSQTMRHSRANSEDECDLYGRIIAKKLRRLPEWERQLLMYKIDGMIINSMEQNGFTGTSSEGKCETENRDSQLDFKVDEE